MKDALSAVPSLLDDLYERTKGTDEWSGFLKKFAVLFQADTATIRLTDLNDPVVYRSYTVGFHHAINQYYESDAVKLDPFRKTLSEGSMGKAVESTSIVSERDFERSEHYQNIFRPNGNFYALGTQFERQDGQAMHIGIHRPKRKGAFTPEEATLLELFSPHLRRAIGLSHLIAELNQSLIEVQNAMDHLPFGVWHTDGKLKIKWMNIAAEEALSIKTYGLGLHGNQLRLTSDFHAGELRILARRLVENHSKSETLKLDQSGACLVMIQAHRSDTGFHIGRSLNSGILCFLIDPARPAKLNQKQLSTLYTLTPAECRLANLLVSGITVNEASARLEISPHTARTQMKSMMRKTDVNRQTALQRKLLLCADALRNPDE